MHVRPERPTPKNDLHLPSDGALRGECGRESVPAPGGMLLDRGRLFSVLPVAEMSGSASGAFYADRDVRGAPRIPSRAGKIFEKRNT